MIDSAMRGAAVTVEAAGGALWFLRDVGRGLYRAVLWVDTRAHGRRALVLTSCLTLAAVFHILARVTEAPGWLFLDNALLTLFVLLSLAFFVGRFLSWESEDEGDGRWPGWDALKELLGGVRGVWDTGVACYNAWFRPGKKNTGRERMETTANLLALLGPPLYLAGRFTDSGWDVLAALILTGAVGFRVGKVLFARFGPQLRVTLGDVGGLAPVIDCVRDPEGARARARSTGSQAIVELVDALCEWNPRRQGNEAGYQRSLVRHLAGNVSMNVSPEHTYYDDRNRCRFDLLLGESVVLEMKTDLGRSDQRDRATGQIRRYAHAWGQRGPVLLVVCETDSLFTRSLIAEDIHAMNAQGLPVFAVAAGRKA
jgi:hypothetical protein